LLFTVELTEEAEEDVEATVGPGCAVMNAVADVVAVVTKL